MGMREVFFFLLLVFSWQVADARLKGPINLKVVVSSHSDILYKTPSTENRIPEALEGKSELCSVCENFTSQAVHYLSDNKTQDEIMEILHSTCSCMMYLEQKCVQFVDHYAAIFFSDIAKIHPEEFCKHVGLCEVGACPTVLRSESTCAFCHHVVEEVLTKLKDPDAEFEILKMLLKECNRIEGYVQQCKRMVLQYVPVILVNGEKFLEKNDICATLHVCEASKKSSIRSFIEEKLVRDA